MHKKTDDAQDVIGLSEKSCVADYFAAANSAAA